MAFDDPQPASFSAPLVNFSVWVAPMTDVGRKRGHNEDSHLILPLDGSAAPQNGEAEHAIY